MKELKAGCFLLQWQKKTRAGPQIQIKWETVRIRTVVDENWEYLGKHKACEP